MQAVEENNELERTAGIVVLGLLGLMFLFGILQSL
jgi:hypothetical protein